MKKVIVTGFQPFGDYTYNPTEKLAEDYNGKKLYDQVLFIGAVLPCTYRGAFEILSQMIDREKPDAVISTGLSSNIKKLRIEQNFKNLMYSKYKDADGLSPDREEIKTGAGPYLESTTEFQKISRALYELRIEAELSTNADTFICNSLAYLTLDKIFMEDLSMKQIFIHTPWTDAYRDKVQLEQGKIFFKQSELYSAIDLIATII